MKIKGIERYFIVFLLILSLCGSISACSSFEVKIEKQIENLDVKTNSSDAHNNNLKLVRAPFYDKVENLPDIMAPENFDWKQFSGVTLNFICETNLYANVLSKECEQFTKITGIKVKIKALDFNTMIEKVNLDFISKTAKYQVVYVDPYQTLTRFTNKLVDLNKFNNDPLLPHIPGGIEDFFKSQVDVDCYFLQKDKLYAIPFDSPTMILFYRKDIFDKYKKKFKEDKGYDWEPGTKSFTWERYYEVAKWINENVPNDEVKYGCGHMAKQHNSLFCDFSNVLAAYGGDYFKDKNIGSLGTKNPYNCIIRDGRGIRALEMYKKIIEVAHPDSTSWDWYGLSQAFAEGEIAMMPHWNEYASMMENSSKSKVAGKVGYSLLPYGPSQSANIFGGSGIGINSDATLEEQKAAWLFIVWVISPHTELLVFNHPEGGDIPLRKSVHNLPEIKNAVSANFNTEDVKYGPQFLPLKVVLQAWEVSNTYQRPKVFEWIQIENTINEEIHRMITQDVSPETTARTIARKVDIITGQ